MITELKKPNDVGDHHLISDDKRRQATFLEKRRDMLAPGSAGGIAQYMRCIFQIDILSASAWPSLFFTVVI